MTFREQPGRPLLAAGAWSADVPCVVMAPGPSLTWQDIERVDQAAERLRCNVIAVGDAWMQTRTAEILYHADEPWWTLHKGCPTFKGRKITQNRNGGVACAQRWGLECVTIRDDPPVGISMEPSFDPVEISHGFHSGFQALNIAVLMGARRIILLGFDNRLGPNGEVHNFGNHPPGLHRIPPFPDFILAHNHAAPVYRAHGIEILNSSRITALTCYPRLQLKDALK